MPTVRTTKQDGNIRLRRKNDGTLTIEQDWHFRIEADSLTQDRLAILYSTPGVPQFNTLYGAYGLVLDSADGDRVPDNPIFWDCVYHLSNNVEEGQDRDPASGSQQTGDPTAWVPWVEAGWEEHQEVLRQSLPILSGEEHPDIGGSDADGYNATKWVNSAGQPYESGFIRTRRLIKRQFTQFDKASGGGHFTFAQMIGRNDLINSVTVLGCAKRTLRLVLDNLAIGTWYGVRCWRGDYSLIYKADDWRLKQLDVGWYYRDDDEKLQPFLDELGNPIVGALDGTGGAASDQTDPAIRYHKEFEESDFAFLRVNM